MPKESVTVYSSRRIPRRTRSMTRANNNNSNNNSTSTQSISASTSIISNTSSDLETNVGIGVYVDINIDVKSKIKVEVNQANKSMSSRSHVIPDEIGSNSIDTTNMKLKSDHKKRKRKNESTNTRTSTKTKSTKVTKVKKIKKESSKSSRPTPEECQYATDTLTLLHPEVTSRSNTNRKTLLESCGMRDDVTDAIISTMLSQNTTDKNSKTAYANLKKTFPSWTEVANCTNITDIEDCIRVAGLAKTRAERIQIMLQTVQKERGTASLQYIQNIHNDSDVKKELSRFKGLGPKTISCVLLFALGRDEFPVDTHVLRITKQMGWVKESDTRESAYEHLNSMVPNHLKMDLHCLLVQHGKCCHKCASRGRPQFPPKDGSKLKCPLTKISSWGGVVPSEMKIQKSLKQEEGNANVNANVNARIKVKREETYETLKPTVKIEESKTLKRNKIKRERSSIKMEM